MSAEHRLDRQANELSLAMSFVVLLWSWPQWSRSSPT
jgi:hypothetical protein